MKMKVLEVILKKGELYVCYTNLVVLYDVYKATEELIFNATGDRHFNIMSLTDWDSKGLRVVNGEKQFTVITIRGIEEIRCAGEKSAVSLMLKEYNCETVLVLKNKNKRKQQNCLAPLTNDEIKSVQNFIEKMEYTKNYYFWSSNGNASQRTYKEEKLSFGSAEMILEGDLYEFGMRLSLSSNNAYRDSYVYKNGSKSNLTVLKKLLQRIDLEMVS